MRNRNIWNLCAMTWVIHKYIYRFGDHNFCDAIVFFSD